MSVNKLDTTQTGPLIEETLDYFFEESIANSKSVGQGYETLWVELHRLIKSGGKRTRPQIMLLTYAAFGGNDVKSVIKIAAALELSHQSLLICDDVIDRDYIRYGVPNIAGRYKELYKKLIDNEIDRVHYANSAAILASSLMLSSSYKLIDESDIENSKKLQISGLFSKAYFEAGGGELLDVESSYKKATVESSLSIARYKTAGYSFINPVVIGAILAGASDSDIELLKTFAENLGMAFQLNDDLLGMFGDEAKTGKSNLTDMREGKGTYLVATYLDTADAKEIEVFERAFGNSGADPKTIELAKDILVRSGAKSKTESKVKVLEDTAMNALNKLELDPIYLQEYIKLADKCLRSHI